VLLGSEPMATPWSVGDLVAARLRWCDNPNLPDDMVMRDVDMRAEVLRDGDGRPWADVVRAGAIAAARPGRKEAGEVRISGCLAYDAFLQSTDQVPVTSGVVRRVRVVLTLHDRGTHGWVPRAGAVRLREVPDTAVEGLRGEPPPTATAPGVLAFLSPEQYFDRYRDQLPARQWQARGFVVDLAVPPPTPAGGFRGGSVAAERCSPPVQQMERRSAS
jgi:hypothetical protein